MTAKFRIAILGLGGVGGFLGGRLASQSRDSNTEVIFIARGENLRAIQSNGLTLITEEGQIVIHPSLITSDPKEIGLVDLIICCVKSYDLESSIETLKPCIGKNTALLPILNGVDASERIRKIFPQAEVWDGCIYIVSRLTSPGVVKVTGSNHALYFGSENGTNEKLKQVETIFQSAAIHTSLSEDILKTIWEKFLFISPLATATSYFDLCVGEIVSNPERKKMLLNLLAEVKSVADAKGLQVANESIQKIIDRMLSLPFETTTSMLNDFRRGSKTELNSLTGYVVEQGRMLNVPTPEYEKAFAALLTKSKAGVA